MIKANELRIGNWIQYIGRHRVEDGSPWQYQVCKVSDSELSVYNVLGEVKVEDFEPIPLTHEILFKNQNRHEL